MNWTRRERKNMQNISTWWKDLTHSFPNMGPYLSWIVGDGTQVRVDINEIMGCSRNIFLPGNIINQLSNFGNAILNHVANHVSSTLWR